MLLFYGAETLGVDKRKALEQCEVPAVAVREFGPKGTPCPLLIGAKIEYIRRCGE